MSIGKAIYTEGKLRITTVSTESLVTLFITLSGCLYGNPYNPSNETQRLYSAVVAEIQRRINEESKP